VPSFTAGEFTVEFEIMSGNVKWTGSKTGTHMPVLIGGHRSSPQWLFHSGVGDPCAGATSGVLKRTTFSMSHSRQSSVSTQVGMTPGYQRIDFVLSTGAVYNIVSAPRNLDLSYPASKHSPSKRYWVDGGQLAPRYNTFSVPPQPCPGNDGRHGKVMSARGRGKEEKR